MPANLGASSASDAFFSEQSKLGLGRLALGIVAPFAIKVTALKKDSCPYSLAVNE
jgi:hypothetical protein